MSSRLQFGLRWVLALPAIAGAVMAAMTTTDKPTALIALWLIVFAQFAFVLALVCYGNRASRVFGAGAACPALIATALAARTLIGQPLNSGRSGFESFVYRNLQSHEMAHLADIRFRVGFLLTASLVGGIVALLSVWLVHGRGETESEKKPISK